MRGRVDEPNNEASLPHFLHLHKEVADLHVEGEGDAFEEDRRDVALALLDGAEIVEVDAGAFAEETASHASALAKDDDCSADAFLDSHALFFYEFENRDALVMTLAALACKDVDVVGFGRFEEGGWILEFVAHIVVDQRERLKSLTCELRVLGAETDEHLCPVYSVSASVPFVLLLRVAGDAKTQVLVFQAVIMLKG